MHFSTLLLSAVTAALAFAQPSTIQVPVAWGISDLRIYNIRHGSGGYWQFNIIDKPTQAPQGFNTTCYYYSGGAYYFAVDGAPFNQPCADPSVTFSLYRSDNSFIFNVKHLWGNCGTAQAPVACNDNGTWTFSKDDVAGQQFDPENNFGQYGGFSRSWLSMYPNRAVASTRCMFC